MNLALLESPKTPKFIKTRHICRSSVSSEGRNFTIKALLTAKTVEFPSRRLLMREKYSCERESARLHLIQIYYTLIFPFITYGIIIWGNTYKIILNPKTVLQKKAVRIITFSHFQSHTSPIFKKLNLLKLPHIVKLHTILFMHQYYNGRLPKAFNDFFSLVKHKH